MNLILRAAKDPWRLMLAVNGAVLIGVFLYKITREPYVPYIHLLVDYHFGFTKRALIGAVVALFFAKVPVWLVFALAGGVWLVTLGLFVELFRRTFGLGNKQMPLFVFMGGSPSFLKNFMHTLGHFDIYGCALAICMLLVPARSLAFVGLAALASTVLVLIHHEHLRKLSDRGRADLREPAENTELGDTQSTRTQQLIIQLRDRTGHRPQCMTDTGWRGQGR